MEGNRFLYLHEYNSFIMRRSTAVILGIVVILNFSCSTGVIKIVRVFQFIIGILCFKTFKFHFTSPYQITALHIILLGYDSSICNGIKVQQPPLTWLSTICVHHNLIPLSNSENVENHAFSDKTQLS